MVISARAGVTRRLRWRDLSHLVTGPVSSGTPVRFWVYATTAAAPATPVGSPVLGPLTAVTDPTDPDAPDNDWYVDIAIPPPGTYVVEAEAVAQGATERMRAVLVVEG